MIALAVRDVFPQLRIDVGEIYVKKGSDWIYAATLPERAEIWRQRFDIVAEHIFGEERLDYLVPFSFEIDIDEWLLMPSSHFSRIKTIIENTDNVTLLL